MPHPADQSNSIVESTQPAITTHEPRKFLLPKSLLPFSIDKQQFRRMVLRDNFPLPGDKAREGYMVGSDKGYWLHGLADFLKTMQVVNQYEIEINSMLDFGCATGRVTRHFCQQLDDIRVWAADINSDHIQWLQRHFPINPRAIQVGQPIGLPIEDDTLDLITAYSVFTHIDELETDWLCELQRVLRPGGLGYLTVHNEDTWKALGQITDPTNRLVESMLLTKSFQRQQLRQPMPESKMVFHFADAGEYRSQVFLSDLHIHKVWSRWFQVVEILPLVHQQQSVVVLRKR